MAHLFGIGAGGRRSADYPENVAWLCLRHHDVLDGRRRLRFDDVRPLLAEMPVDTDEPFRCVWYCERRGEEIRAYRPLCALHERIATGGDEVPVPTRRAELGLALSFIVEKANRSMGLRP